MDIEAYTAAHPHYWVSELSDPELQLLFQNNSFERVIDVGCGSGAFLYALKMSGYLDGFNEVWATDLSRTRLVEIEKVSSKIKTIQSDAQELAKIPSDYFDLVVSTDVIEHVKDDTAMLKAIYRICRVGGIVFLKTVIKTRFAWYFNKNVHHEWVLDPTHEREYKHEHELYEKISASGLRLVGACKDTLKFPLLDFFVRRLKMNASSLYESNLLLKAIRSIRIPIWGYYSWRLLLIKSK